MLLIKSHFLQVCEFTDDAGHGRILAVVKNEPGAI